MIRPVDAHIATPVLTEASVHLQDKLGDGKILRHHFLVIAIVRAGGRRIRALHGDIHAAEVEVHVPRGVSGIHIDWRGTKGRLIHVVDLSGVHVDR